MARLDTSIDDNVITFRIIEDDGTVGESTELTLPIDYRFAKDQNTLIITSRNTDAAPQLINFDVVETDITGQAIIAKLTALPDNERLPYNIIRGIPDLRTINVTGITTEIDNGNVKLVLTFEDGRKLETTLPASSIQSTVFYSSIDASYAQTVDPEDPIPPGRWDNEGLEVDTLILKNPHVANPVFYLYTRAKGRTADNFIYRGPFGFAGTDSTPGDGGGNGGVTNADDLAGLEAFARTSSNQRVPDAKLPTNLARTGANKPASEITTSGHTENIAGAANVQAALDIIDGLALGEGGTVSGITRQAAIDLILEWARSGNSDRIPKDKLPTDAVYTDSDLLVDTYVKTVEKVQDENAFNVTLVVDGTEQAPVKITFDAAGTEGLTEDQVRDLIEEEVESWAWEGDDDPIPTDKIPPGLLAEGTVFFDDINFPETTVHGTNIRESNVPGVHTWAEFPNQSATLDTSQAKDANGNVVGIIANGARMAYVTRWIPTGTTVGTSLHGILNTTGANPDASNEYLHVPNENDGVLEGIDNNKTIEFDINSRDEHGNQGIGATSTGHWQIGNITAHYEGAIHVEAVQIIRAQVASQLADIRTLVTNIQGIANRADENATNAKRKTDLISFANKFGDYEDFDFRIGSIDANLVKAHMNISNGVENLKVYVRFSGDGGLSDPLFQFRKDINGTSSGLGNYVGSDTNADGEQEFVFDVTLQPTDTLKVERRSIEQTLAFLLRLGAVEESIEVLRSSQYVPSDKLVAFLNAFTYQDTTHVDDQPWRSAPDGKIRPEQAYLPDGIDFGDGEFVPVDHATSPANVIPGSIIQGRFVSNSFNTIQQTWRAGSEWMTGWGDRMVSVQNGYQFDIQNINADEFLIFSQFSITKGSGTGSDELPLTTWWYDGFGGYQDLIVFNGNKIKGKVEDHEGAIPEHDRTVTRPLRFASGGDGNLRYIERLEGDGEKVFWFDVPKDEGRTYTIDIRNATRDYIPDGRAGSFTYTVTDPNTNQADANVKGSGNHVVLASTGQPSKLEVIHARYVANDPGAASNAGRVYGTLPQGIAGNVSEDSAPNVLLITGRYNVTETVPQIDATTTFDDFEIADYDINVPAVETLNEPIIRMIEYWNRDTDGSWQCTAGVRQGALDTPTFRDYDSAIPADAFNRSRITKFRSGFSVYIPPQLAIVSGSTKLTRAELEALLAADKYYSTGTDIADADTRIAPLGKELLPPVHTETPVREYYLGGDKIPSEGGGAATPTTIQATVLGEEVITTGTDEDWVDSNIAVPDLASVGDNDLFSVSVGRPQKSASGPYGQSNLGFFSGEALKAIGDSVAGDDVFTDDDEPDALTFRLAYTSSNTFEVVDFWLGKNTEGNFLVASRETSSSNNERPNPLKIVHYKAGPVSSGGSGANITNAPINVDSPDSEPPDEGASRRSIATAISEIPTGTDGQDGTDGRDGTDGTDGVGVPAGGTTGQHLAKIDGTNYNTEWVNPPTGGTELSQADRDRLDKVDGIEAGAEVNPTNLEIVGAVNSEIGNADWQRRLNNDEVVAAVDAALGNENWKTQVDLSSGFHRHSVASQTELDNVQTTDGQLDLAIITTAFGDYVAGDILLWIQRSGEGSEWHKIGNVEDASGVEDWAKEGDTTTIPTGKLDASVVTEDEIEEFAKISATTADVPRTKLPITQVTVQENSIGASNHQVHVDNALDDMRGGILTVLRVAIPYSLANGNSYKPGFIYFFDGSDFPTHTAALMTAPAEKMFEAGGDLSVSEVSNTVTYSADIPDVTNTALNLDNVLSESDTDAPARQTTASSLASLRSSIPTADDSDLSVDDVDLENTDTFASRHAIARAIKAVKDTVPDLSSGFHFHSVATQAELDAVVIDDSHLDLVLVTADFGDWVTGDVLFWDTRQDPDAWVKLTNTAAVEIEFANDVSPAQTFELYAVPNLDTNTAGVTQFVLPKLYDTFFEKLYILGRNDVNGNDDVASITIPTKIIKLAGTTEGDDDDPDFRLGGGTDIRVATSGNITTVSIINSRGGARIWCASLEGLK